MKAETQYSKQDVEALAKHIGGYGDKFLVLSDFFYNHLECGHLEQGLSIPGSSGSALVVTEMEQLFPDALEALKMKQEDLVGFLSDRIGQEHPIAVWRLGRKQ